MSEKIEYKFELPAGWTLLNFPLAYQSISLNGIKIKQKQYQTSGKYPVVDQGQDLIGGYYDNDKLVVSGDPPFIIFGDHTKVKKFVNFKFIAGADGVKVLKPYTFYDPRLFFYFLHCIKLPDKGYARHYQFLSNADFPLPPLAEQQRIVAKIEELFSSLDKGIESLKTAQAQLKTYRQAVLKWAFEGKLTNENVKDGELPEGWKCVDFGSLFMGTPQNGLYKPSSEYGSGTPILRIDGFYDGQLVTDYDFKRVRLSSDEISKYLLSPNDIVVNRVNSMAYLGKCGLVNALKEKTVFESNVMKIQLDIKKSIPRYITYFLSSLRGVKELTKNAKQAVNQASINQTDVAKAQIPLAPITEQSCIVSEIEKRLSVCDKLEESITQSLSQAEALRQSILKKAFKGKLVPQDPSDEPASVLLERIRAERANSTPVKKTRTPKEKK